MRYRKLGRTGFEVSEIGYGAWGIGANMWFGGSDHESLAALRLAIQRGVTFIDTALVYGDEGHSERLIGGVLRELREQRIYVASKVPPKNRLWPARPGVGIEDVFPYDYIVECTEQSLRNLRVETLDLQQLHVWNPEWIDHEDWRRAFEDLKRSGKILAAGVSLNNHQPDSGLDLVNTGLIDTVQVIYNIFDQSPERTLFPLCQSRHIGVIARVPLDEGGLTGTIDEYAQFDPRDFRARYFSGDRKRQVAERVKALEEDLGLEDRGLPEVALRFCLSHPAVSTVIAGMRSRRHVQANVSVPGQGPLPAKTLEILRKHAWQRDFYAAEPEPAVNTV